MTFRTAIARLHLTATKLDDAVKQSAHEKFDQSRCLEESIAYSAYLISVDPDKRPLSFTEFVAQWRASTTRAESHRKSVNSVRDQAP